MPSANFSRRSQYCLCCLSHSGNHSHVILQPHWISLTIWTTTSGKPDTTDRRCLVFLDSTHKLDYRADPYDLIEIDECVFVEYYFLAGISRQAFQVMRVFQELLRDALQVICIQQRCGFRVATQK
jgi:hypothetical protein